MTELFTHQVVVDDGVLFCAFRYALGRRTYVVSEVCEAITQNTGAIQRKLRNLMIKEITEAIDGNHAGDDMDIKQWKTCRIALQQSLMSEQQGSR